MDNYIVSARKYRPATFDTVVGQNALTTTLKNAIATGKLAHAYLFCGPRGVGKTTCARIFAKTINCQHPKDNGEACGECESCKAFDEGRSYNIHELDAASNNSVEDIRSLIEQVAIPPQVGRYKVFIIDEVHMLSQAAFNAFLKTLEEPPAHAVFILATTEKHKILPTILSRCQIYDFNRMEVADIVSHLKHVAEKEGIAYEENALGIIARKADGGMRDAMSIFDQVAGFSNGNITYKKVIEDLNVLDYDYYFNVTDALLKPDIPATLLLLNEILSKGFEANHFMSGLAAHFRDLLVSHDAQTLPLLEVDNVVRERYKEQASRCKPRFLYRALKLCNSCDVNYRTSSNKRLLVELTLIEIAQADEDGDGCGRGPAKKLKPIFAPTQPTQVAATLRPAPTTAQTKPATSDVANPIATTPVAPNATPAASNAEHPTLSSAPSTSSAMPNHAQTLSIHLQHHASSSSPAPIAKTEQNVASQAESFDQKALSYQWLRYAATLPVEQAAMAGRMKNMEPKKGQGATVDIPVENELVVKYMEQLREPLTAFLRQNLRNDNITLNFRLIEKQDVKRAYSRREVYAEMLKKSSALTQLAKELSLELS